MTARPQDLLDTQLVSYMMKTHVGCPSDGFAITSVTAQELLLVYGDHYTRNNYYIPFVHGRLPHHLSSPYALLLRSAPLRRRSGLGRNHTDRFVLNFGRDYPAVVEYSHVALANALNRGQPDLIASHARALGRQRHRVVVRRLKFLLDHGVHCHALTERSATTALELFAAFVARYELKSRFRNSLNDILTLAVAVDAGDLRLRTADLLLAQFAHAHLGVSISDGDRGLELELPVSRSRRFNGESKGYVNLGWRVHR